MRYLHKLHTLNTRALVMILAMVVTIGTASIIPSVGSAARDYSSRIVSAMRGTTTTAMAVVQDKSVQQGKPEPPAEVSVIQYDGPIAPTPNNANQLAAAARLTETEPNGTPATATAIGVSSGKIVANLYPNGDIDYFSFTATAGDRFYAATMTSFSAGSSTDSQLTLLASDGTTVIEFDDDNGSFAALSSSIAGAIIPSTGVYYLKVNDFTAGTTSERPYELWFQIQSGTPTPEVEGNDTPATANPLPSNGWVSGTRNPAAATEQDWFSLSLNAGDTVFLSLDVNPERDGTVWNGRLGFALFGDAANQILVVDDAGTGDVSPVPNNPSEAFFMTVKTAGTYFAFVDSASAAVGGPTATYNLSVSVLPAKTGVNCTTYTSTDVPKTIGPGTGLTSSVITVPGNPRIEDIDVTIVLNHALMQDIDAHLRSPAGNNNGLFSDIGAANVGGQQQMDTTFDDEAGVTPNFTVLKGLQYKPENNATAGTANTSGAYRLASFYGENGGGTWTLDLRDDTANANGGTLTAWSIRICEEPPLPSCPAGTRPVTVFSTDFESGAAGFTHSGAQDEWQLGLPNTAATTTANPVAAFNTCNSGVNCWKTDLTGTYNASSNQDLLSPNINLAGLSGPVIVTWAMRHQIETANFDHMFIDFQQVGGATPVRLYEWMDPTPISASAGTGNPQENIGGSYGWGVFSRRVDSLAGLNTEIRFHLDSDTTVQFGGLAVDDVSVTACEPCPAPVCPTNIVTNTDPNQCSAVVSYTPPTTPGCAVTCTPAPGSTFPRGITTVTCSNGSATTCSFTVTVNDTQAPTVACPSNISGVPVGIVTYPTPTANDNCPGATVVCSPASGSSFPLGTTTVTCTATDAANLTGTCTFTITTISPCTITCPANQVAWTAGLPVPVNYPAPTTVGNCGTVTCTPPSGSNFAVGTTTVTCSTNAGPSCSFNVTVNRLTLGASVSDPLACNGPGDKINGAFSATNTSGVSATVVLTATLSNLVYLPGTASATTAGTISTGVGTIIWTGTLGAGQSVIVSYLGQIADNVAPGSLVCSTTTATANGLPVAGQAQGCLSVNCPAVGPGGIFPAASEASDQKAGSLLVYNIYTSSTDPTRQNTRINITNTHMTRPAFVHLFFVAEGCAVADSYICLTGNQTASFLASDLDPGTTGYLVAVAVDGVRGCPTSFNYLIGDEYVKFNTGHAANLGAIAFSQLAGGLPACDGNSVLATLNFDGISYNRTPAVLALDNVGSRADGNDTLLILNRIGGNLGIGAASLGSLFGIFYDDAENALSFSVTGGCQFRSVLNNNFPRITPRFETFVPAGRTGWLRMYNQTGAIGMTGAAINFNANAASSAGAFNQGHNLHHLTLNNQMSYIIPVFPPSC